MKIILLRLNAGTPDWVSWIGIGDEQSSAITSGSLAEAGLACREADRRIVLVPATDVLLAKVNIPGRSRKRTIQAAPFAMEEQLAEDIEKLHFAFGPRNPDSSLDVAVVNKKRLAHWLELLNEAGLEPDYLTAESLAVPYLPGSWTILFEKDLALLRTGLRAGLGLDRNNLQEVIESEFNSAGSVTRPQFQIYQTETSPLGLDLQLTPPPLIIKTSALAAMAQGFNPKLSINLLQGEFGRKTDWDQLRERWQLPSFLALVLLILIIGQVGIDLVLTRRDHLDLNRRAEAVYRAAFPEAKQVVNPKAQMEQQLAALSSDQESESNFLKVLATIGPDLQKTEGCVLQRLRFHGNTTELELTLASLEALDDLKERLQTNNQLDVEIRTASNTNNQVSARLEIKEAKP